MWTGGMHGEVLGVGGCWREPGTGGGVRGLQERHVHRKLHCGSLSVGWQHFNGGLIAIMDTRGRGRDERTRSAHRRAHNEQLRARTCVLCVEGDSRARASCTCFLLLGFFLCFTSSFLYETHFLKQPQRTRGGVYSKMSPNWTSLHNTLHFTAIWFCIRLSSRLLAVCTINQERRCWQ